MNPFETIETRLDNLERLIRSMKPTEAPKKRFANIPEFSQYSGLSIHTIYSKLSRNKEPEIPGAFKAGPKQWLVDLDEWDRYLEKKKAEFQS